MRAIHYRKAKRVEEEKMKTWIKILALLTAAAIAFGLTGCRPNRALSDEEKDRIQTRFQACIDDRGVSAAVYAVYRDEVIFDGGGGMASDTLENGSDVAYGVASLSKQVTAAAVMQLYEDGLLDITDPIGKYFTDYRYGDKISITQLLSQRSGIPDYMVNSAKGKVVISVDQGGKNYVLVDTDNTAEENQKIIRDFFLSRELLFEPGTAFDYSDSNYALLAQIVSQVSGMSYHDYVRKNIFEPLGMEQTDFIDDYDHEKITKVAKTDRTEFSMDYYTVKGAEYGCGDVLTTPQDWYRWYRGLTDGAVVGKAAYELMTTNYSVWDELGYGFGLMISEDGDAEVLYHYGWIPSSYSSMFMIPGQDIFAAVLCNSSRGYPHNAASAITERYCEYIGLKIGEIS